VGRALAAFMSGKGKEAAALLRGDSSQEGRVLQAKISRFVELYEAASREHRNKRAEAAITSLKRALAFEDKIAGGRSSFAGDIAHKLADSYYLRGVEHFSGVRYAEAFRAFRKASAQEEGHEGTKRMVGRLVSRAEGFVAQADGFLQRGDRGKALQLYQRAAKMVPTRSEVYERAKRGLQKAR
jgi:tetratricopeptide (TPR) repeat protein